MTMTLLSRRPPAGVRDLACAVRRPPPVRTGFLASPPLTETIRNPPCEFVEKGSGISSERLEHDQALHEIQTPFAQFIFAHEGWRLAQKPGELGLRSPRLMAEADQLRETGAIRLGVHGSSQDPAFSSRRDRLPPL